MLSPADAAHPVGWRRHWTPLVLLAVIAGSWGVFWEVAHELREDVGQPDQGFPFDRPILDALHNHPTPALCRLAGWLSDLNGPVWWGAYALLAAFVIGLLAWRHYRGLGFFVVAVGGTMGLNLLAKHYFERLRPAFYHQVCWEQAHKLPDASFPSGHTMASVAFACAAGILLWRSRGRWVAWGMGLAFALGVAWSRVYLSEHFPSDVLAGWFAASAWIWSVYLVFSRYAGELKEWSRQLLK